MLGGAGYIGSVVAAELMQQGIDVVIYDNLSTGHEEALPEGATIIHGDSADHSVLKNVLNEHHVEAVMHFAASTLVGESMQWPGLYFSNNVANTINVLNTMLEAGVKNFVFSSSCAVYGTPDRVPIDESTPTHPNNPYGESKLMIEQMLRWYSSQNDLHYASLRYFNAAGATEAAGEDHYPETHLIPLTLNAVLGFGPPLTIYGTDYPTLDGTCVRDYVHVLDLAAAHILALQKVLSGDNVICNLGNGKGFSVREVVDTVSRIAGKRTPVVEGAPRLGDPAVLVASSDNARQTLRWQPKHTELGAIIESALRWRVNHPHGYQK